ncbi:MAG TPA: Spy/CpxP family protein refolding chaperone [Candidatus Aquilonibacter sp.]|nr:Spy/CpxP family protein refolding chaperone [Candidatus Aquilonibacter sp.]
MKAIRFRLAVAAVAVMLGSAIANSQTADTTPPPPPAHGPGMFGMDHHMIQFYVKALGITDDQQTQMKAALQKERSTMKPLMQQMHQLDEQLQPYVEGTYDATKVQALVTQQEQTLVQLKVEEARIHNELYLLLTPDQQSKLKEIQAERQARMQQRMQQQSAPSPESQQ